MMKKAMAIAVIIIAFALVFTACSDIINFSELDGKVSLSNYSPKVGDPITAVYTPGNGTGTETWQWFRSDEPDTPIEGASDNTYTATPDDVGKLIIVQLSFANQTGSRIASTKSAVAAVINNPDNGEAAPTVNESTPGAVETNPTDNGSTPDTGETNPTDNGSTPGAVETNPTDNGSTPDTGETNPIDNGSTPGAVETNPTDNGTPVVVPVPVVPADPLLSRFLGWEWTKPSDGFVWVFENNGTITTIHHCGLEFDSSFSYILYDNVLITYGNEMDADELVVTTFTMTDDGLSFTLIKGSQQIKFVRGEAVTGPSSKPTWALSNGLLGTWRTTDGTEYKFSSDAGLLINSEEYRYLVRVNSKLVTFGPLDGETKPVIKEYGFKREGNSLKLTPSGGSMITLSLKK